MKIKMFRSEQNRVLIVNDLFNTELNNQNVLLYTERLNNFIKIMRSKRFFCSKFITHRVRRLGVLGGR